MSTPPTAAQNTENPAPTPEERIDAIEALLGHLILVLEAEPRFTAEKLNCWLDICMARMQETRSASPQALQALAALRSTVLA